tara:strand:- start:1203 stop:1757 length:555 start_codon:yes stop_codon:yes gene_type:complete
MSSNYDPKLDLLRQMLALSIVSRLEEAGFAPEPPKAAVLPALAEKIYSRVVGDPEDRMKVLVYTTVFGGTLDRPLDVRKEGRDAIRVCGVYVTKDGKTKGLVKERRVHRVGNIEDIVERMITRMRDAWKSLKTGQRCNRCGAPKFVSKKGHLCCAEICWVEEKNNRRSLAYKSRLKSRNFSNKY